MFNKYTLVQNFMSFYQYRQCAYNVTLRRFCATTVAVEKQ